ncbi:MAG: pilus assembly protein TadG-related protein [Novosphingobium sp.]
MRPLRAWLKNLRDDTGGNAALLVSIGMPALLGSAGLAVDVGQWYMWKNELQYAVDQAALAGAWARTDEDTKDTYVTRARQEFTANSQTSSGISVTPSVSLSNYASEVNNAVTVTTTATRTLPFSGILMNRGVTIRVSAQASFAPGLRFTSCLIATDNDDSGAITIGGSAHLVAACGIASLSTSPSSVVVNGNPTVNAGWVVSAGGIDNWFNLHTNDSIHEYMDNLYDPFASLTPPTNNTARTYSCAGGVASATATTTATTLTQYTYWKGPNTNQADEQVEYSGAKPDLPGGPTTMNNVAVPVGTLEGSTSTSTSSVWAPDKVDGTGNGKVWEKATTTTTTTYTNVLDADTGQGSIQPGTYSSIKVKCNTVFAPGIYVINGGGLSIDGRYAVTGAGVMFVLKNGAYLKINGGTNVNLTAPTEAQLVSAGVSGTQAALLSGMLVFEDRNSTGSNQTRINGNTSTVLNGIMYFPASTMNFAGTATVSSQCLMIAAKNIVIEGTADMSTFCPSGSTSSIYVSTGTARVRLVS